MGLVIEAAAPGVNAWRTGCSLIELITMVMGSLKEVQWSWRIAWEACITSSSIVHGAPCYLNVLIVVPTVIRTLLRNMQVHLEENKIREPLRDRKFPKVRSNSELALKQNTKYQYEETYAKHILCIRHIEQSQDDW